jgi:hypothetical protein
MTVLFASLDTLEVHHLKHLLEVEGIRCTIRNELLSRLAGEIPFTECAMQLVVLRPEDEWRARRVLADWRESRPATGPDWQCAQCGEHLEAQFTTCWRCGSDRGPKA